MKARLFYVFTLLLILRIDLYSQNISSKDSIVDNHPFDTLYIVKYPNYLSINIFNNVPSATISVVDAQKKTLNSYKSNVSNIVGLDFDYRGISIILGYRIKNDFTSVAEKGKTDFKTLKLTVHKHKFNMTLSYLRIKSFYDDQSYLKAGNDSIHPYTIDPNLAYKRLNFTFLYSLNPNKYSYLAPLTYTERQVKSKGGWLTGGGFSYNQLSDTGSLVRNFNTTNLDNDTLNKKINIYALKLGFGRGMNLIIAKRVFLNVQLMPMISLAYVHTVNNLKDNQALSPNILAEFALGLGYNSKRFFSGLRAYADVNSVRRNKLTYNTNIASLQFTIGYRFNSPKWLDTGYDKVRNRAIRISGLVKKTK